MIVAWAFIATLVASVVFFVSDPSSILMRFAELGGVVALFTLVCAAEAFSEPKA